MTYEPESTAAAPVVSARGQRWRAWHEKFVVEQRYMEAPARRGLYITSVVLAIVGLAFFISMLVGVKTHTGFATLDKPVETWIDTQRSGGTTGVMIALAIIFGPVALPLIVLAVTVLWGIFARHAWRPLVLAGAMITGVILAEVLSYTVQRPRPPIGLMLFGADKTFSFPSGHVLGTSDFLLVLAFLIVSRRPRAVWVTLGFVIAIAGIASQVVSRLYLGYHWLTDTLASVSLSLVVLAAVIAIDTWRTVRVPGEKIEGDLSKPQTDGT